MRTATLVALSGALAIAGFPLTQQAQAAPNDAPTIIPALQEWTGGEGAFQLSADARIIVDAALADVGAQFGTRQLPGR